MDDQWLQKQRLNFLQDIWPIPGATCVALAVIAESDDPTLGSSVIVSFFPAGVLLCLGDLASVACAAAGDQGAACSWVRIVHAASGLRCPCMEHQAA